MFHTSFPPHSLFILRCSIQQQHHRHCRHRVFEYRGHTFYINFTSSTMRKGEYEVEKNLLFYFFSDNDVQFKVVLPSYLLLVTTMQLRNLSGIFFANE